METYYSEVELKIITAQAKCFEELESICTAMMYLSALGERVDIYYLKKIVNERLIKIYESQ